jgi:hypothetical protein
MKRQTHALARGRLMQQEVPQVQPQISGVQAATRRSFAAEETLLKTAPTPFIQRVTLSSARRGHGDGHLTVWLRTQAVHWNRVPVHRVAVRKLAREDRGKGTPQQRQSAVAAREGAHVQGAPERVDVGWRARSPPTPPGTNVVRSRVWGQGSFPGGGSLRAQMIAESPMREGGRRKRITQLLRGAQQSLPGMIRCHSSTGGSTEVKGSLGVRLPRCGPNAFRVPEMSEVTRTFTGQHLTNRKSTSGEIKAQRLQPGSPGRARTLQARRHAEKRR